MKIIILGDIIIDQYVYGTSTRLSPEAPVPVVTQQSVTETLGGAGLVYNNLANLGVDVDLFEYSHPKSTKTRVICDGHYITRIDSDIIMEGNDTIGLISEIDFTQYDYALLIDYDKGLLGQSVEIIKHINNTSNCKIIVDPKRAAHDYKGAWLVKPNGNEYSKFGFDSWNGNIITTNANESVSAILRDDFGDQEFSVPVENVEVSDVTGAGDCFMAGFVYGLTKGYTHKKCLEIAVKGSTESVKHSGTYILKQEDVEERVIFTNGVFDIMHTGHFNLLKEARSLGDKLVVGLNSDASVKRLKGNDRPVNNIEKRVEQISMLPWVDEVHVFEQDTPYELIKYIQPNLIVKGGDYTVETVVGHDLADVHLIPTVKGYSTTNIIENSK